MKTKLRCCENEHPWRTAYALEKRVRIRALWLLFTAIFLGGGFVQASHFVGGEITYRNLNPQGNSNVYEVTLRFFRDCSGITFGSSQQIQVSPTNSGSVFTLPLFSTTEITPLCPGQVSRCANANSTVFGVQEVIFRTNITLNPLPAGQFYTISQASCCRNPGITRLVNSSNQGWYLQTTLNPTLSPRNSSPTFLNPPVSFFCAGQPAIISPTAFDPDNDDLVYSLIPCRQTVTTNVAYVAGFTGTTPLSTTGGFNFNTFSGELSFTPNAVQSSVVCVQVDEYRSGVLIGSIVRDIQIVIQSCNNTCPVITQVTNQVVNVGQTYCVNINATDADLDNITLTLVSSVGTFTQTGAGAGFANGTFCFTPSLVNAGNTYTVTINARDNSCPATCTTPLTFNITVPVPCNATASATSTPATCGQSNGTATAVGTGFTPPVSYSWSNGASGSSISGLAAGTYTVTVVGGSGCVANATVTVATQGSNVSVTAVGANPTCPNTNDGSITVSASNGTAPFTYTLNGGAPQASNVFSGLSQGIYIVTAIDAFGCASQPFTVQLIANDNVPPVIACPANISVGNDAGQCSAVVTFAATATDNCPGSVTVTQTAGPASGSSFGLGTTPVSFSATDAFNNSASCSFTVTVSDNENPSIVCPANISVSNDAGVCGAVVSFGVQASDNCPGVTTAQTAGLASGSTFGIGSTTNSFTAVDASGNTASCSFTVTVSDNENPTISCPGNLTVNTDAGTCGAVVTYGVQASDNCPGVTTAQTAGQASGTSFPLGSTTNSFTATDAAGNTASCSFTVTVVDAGAPTISCPANISVSNDAGVCGAAVTFSLQGSDNCPGATTAQTSGLASGSTFPVGTTTNTFTVTAGNGQTASCSFTVTVNDTEAPNAICQDITVNLNANGQGSINANQVNNGSTDNCAIASVSVDRTAFDCNDVASVAVVPSDLFFSEYIEGSGNNKCVEIYNGTGAAINLAAGGYAVRVYFNGATTFSTFNLTGTVAAGDVYVFCQQNATSGFIAQADQTTNAGIWTGDDAVVLVKGTQMLDIIGRIGEDPGSAWVAPGIQTSERTLVRNANIAGGVTTNPSAGFPTMPTEWTSLGTDVSSNLGSHTFTPNSSSGATVTLTVTDVNGNSSTCQANVTVLDLVPPTALCQNVTVQLDANGSASVTAQQVNNGSSDACGIDNLSVTPSSFNCSNVGANTVTLTVTDVNGNSSTCQATVTVQDLTPPTAVCQNVTVQLDGNGNGSITAQQVNGGSTDNCAIASLSLSNTAFSCQNVGANNTVVLTVTDVNGNSSTCSATVTVEDNVDPIAICQDIQVELDANGTASIVASQVDGGSTDNCAIASIAVSNDSFDCSDILPITPTGLFISEYIEGASNNKCIEIYNGTGSAVDLNAAGYELRIFFNGNTSPNTVIDLTGVVAAGDVYVVCDDNAIATFTNQADQLSTSNFFNGNDAVVLAINGQAVDIFGRIGENPGNEWVGTTNHTMDRTLVRASTVWQGVSQNPSAGFPTLDNEWVEFPLNYSADLGSHTFTPASGQIVTLTVTDVNGNTSSCEALVGVNDSIAPNAICQNLTVQLDANGNASITAQQVDNGSNDACGIASLGIDNSTFGCQNVGSGNTVTLTVTDVNGNVSTCTATVTVEDKVAPVAICQNLTVQLDANGNASITAQQVDNGSSDACGIASLSLDNTSFGCQNVGSNNTVTLTVTDVNGNSSTCTAQVTVEDNVAPNAICQNVTVQLDANGNGSITAQQVDNGSSDACGIASLSIDNTSFGCQNVGSSNTVTLTVTDVNGNVSTCSATVSVEDNVAPVALCQDVVVFLDNNGAGSTTANAVDNGSNDACGIASLSLNPSTFGCQNVGGNVVTLTVTDVNGNVSTCTATATVIDSVAPVALCQDVTVTLDNQGNGSVTATQVDNGSNDACGIASLSVSPDTFGCNELGANVVTLTATDVNGNSSTCTATVTVVEGNFTEIQCPADITTNCETGEGGAFVSWPTPTAVAYTSCTEPCSTVTNICGMQSLGTYGGSQYFVSNSSNYTWAQANAAAIAAGGHLVVINNAGENNFLNGNLNCNYVWIGYTDQATEGNFDWVNGDPDSYTNWQQGEPNNGGGSCCYGSSGSDYAVFNSSNGRWYDKGGCDRYAFIIEITCPNTVTIAQIGGPAPGSLFPEGTTTVTYVATNNFGTTDTCSFNVTVESRFEIACPTDINLPCQQNNGGNCGPNQNSGGRTVSWPEPTVIFDNCRTDACPSNVCISGFSYLGEYNGHRYYYRNGNYSWGQAFSAAQNAGGHLATINDAGENAFITNNLNTSYAWIGLNDAGIEGTFRWSNNEPVSYTNWMQGEPNNNGSGCCNNSGADYAVLRRSNGKWYDQGSCADYGFVMEIPCFGYTLVQTAGPVSGSFFTEGTTTTIGYMAYTTDGDTVRCSFDVTIDECPPVYCESEGQNTCSEWIQNVTLCDVNNTSGNNGGYGNYTHLTANLVAGQQYTINLTPGYSGQAYREYWRVWIDWNRDGDFNDAQEMAFQGNGYGPGSGTISVPTWASNRPIRMRVAMRWNCYSSSACSNFHYGEVEDYTLLVAPSNSSKTAPSQPEGTQPEFADVNETGPTPGFEFTTVYPNPAVQVMTQSIQVEYRSGTDESVSIRIMDLNGRELVRKQVAAIRGVNQHEIGISNLAVGTYLLEVSSGDARTVEEIVIQ